MPGLTVRVTVSAGPAGSPTVESGRYFVTAVTERGRTTAPVEVRSYRQLVDEYGPATAYTTAHDDLSVFFGEGGGVAYVARVVGPAATVGQINLTDGAGTPANVVLVKANGAGAWSSRVSVVVEVGSTSGSRTLIVKLDGVEVERFADTVSTTQIVSRLEASRYVRGTSLSATMPAAQTVTLTAGADDRASITGAAHVAALGLFGDALGDGAVGCPGQPSSAVGVGVVAHCQANHRVGLLTAAAYASQSQAETAAAAVSSEHAGLFWPHVLISDGAGGSRAVGPEGFVAAVRARAHTATGPARPPAGEIGAARTLVGTVTPVDETVGNQVNAKRVSAIRQIGGRPRLYGWRSLSVVDTDWYLLSHRDLINRLVVDAARRLEPYVFRPLTGLLYAQVAAELKAMVVPFAATGQLYPRQVDGEEADPGYAVDVGPTLNTPAVAAANELRATLAVRVAPAGEMIVLDIVKAPPTVTLTGSGV